MRGARKISSWIALIVATVLITAGEANAITFRILDVESPRGLADPNPGDVVTISLRIEGASGLYGLGASAWGYDESVIDFTTGQTVTSINHAVLIPSVGQLVGLSNTLTNPLTETAIGSNGNRVLFFNGAGLIGTNSNPLDPGLDGQIGGGDAHVRLTFTVTGPGRSVIRLGTGYAGDGAVLAGGIVDQSANVELWVGLVPEPGTALLVGLGLAGLAAYRERAPR